MTIEDFDKMKFTSGMKCMYNNVRYNIVSVSFPERLISLDLDGEEMWVRCENVILIK